MGDIQDHRKISVFENEQELVKELCSFVLSLAERSIEDHGIFTVGLSGGSLAKFLCSQLPKATTDWSKWRIFFCDERHVPYDDAECTYNIYKENWFDKAGVPESSIFPSNPDVSVDDAADLYSTLLRSVFPAVDWPCFDLLLLGMGPDGHTCSLFPGHQLLQERTRWIAAISDSPKPPPERITMTFPLLQNAKNAVFAATGAGKAAIVHRVLEGKESPPLPAAQVCPHDGVVHWFLDKDAARMLQASPPHQL